MRLSFSSFPTLGLAVVFFFLAYSCPFSLAADDDTTTTTLPNIVARYKNDEGVAALLSVDADGEIDIQIERFCLAAITVANDADVNAIVEESRANDNIEAVVSDFSRDLEPPGPVDEPYVEEDEEGGRRRKLKKESVEYGIKLVQADQLFDFAGDAP
jgi:hypothetical protein